MQILISLVNIYGALRKIQCIASVKKIPCVISISLNYLLWYPATGFFRISQSRASFIANFEHKLPIRPTGDSYEIFPKM